MKDKKTEKTRSIQIQVSDLHLPIRHSLADLRKKAAKAAGLPPEAILDMRLLRRSIDARKKPDLHYNYRVALTIPAGQSYGRSRQVSRLEPVCYLPAGQGAGPGRPSRPVVVGMGPAGLFAAYLLALRGECPLVIERGRPVEERIGHVEAFWESGCLNTASNVQFGEGGAGAFSDGKLNTGVKDRFGRNRFVLESFVKFGAPEDILYDAKPHIGTDVLVRVIANMRKEILRLGGRIRYSSLLTGLDFAKGPGAEGSALGGNGQSLAAVWVNGSERIPANACILAIGHSARDTFRILQAAGVPMKAKAFAVGLRIEHPQQMIDLSQYGRLEPGLLPPAPYKLTGKCASGRSAYSFCMCPGGYVVNASSEEKRIAVNGMSNRAQDAHNANSAIVLTVSPEDFDAWAFREQGRDRTDPLAGMYFQQALEERAWALGGGRIPQQLFGDYERGVKSSSYGDFASCVKGQADFANLQDLFPYEMNADMIEAIHAFGRKIRGFDRPDAILSGVESRTSSPVRIPRDDTCQSVIRGLYPCGEGAGYAGGISSAAMDGLKCAEAYLKSLL